MDERYFEDFEIGQRFVSKGVSVTESQILDFALAYDPQPFHLDREAAARSPYGGLIASGFQTLVLGFRMFYQEKIINACSMGSPGMADIRWLRPVRPGDTLHSEVQVKDVRPSRTKPDRGTIDAAFAINNQHGETVMTFLTTIILARRP